MPPRSRSSRCRRSGARARTSSAIISPGSGSTEPHDELVIKLIARVTVEDPVEAAPQATPRWQDVRDAAFAINDIGPRSPAHYLFPSRHGVARSRDPRLCARELSAGPAGARRRDRPDAADQGRFHLRDRRHHGDDHAADVVRAAPRRLPGLRAYHDLRDCAASACRRPMSAAICAPSHGPAAERLVGADAMHAWVLVWCGEEAGWMRARSDQRACSPAKITSCWRSAATMRTSRRSTAWWSPPAASASASRSASSRSPRRSLLVRQHSLRSSPRKRGPEPLRMRGAKRRESPPSGLLRFARNDAEGWFPFGQRP